MACTRNESEKLSRQKELELIVDDLIKKFRPAVDEDVIRMVFEDCDMNKNRTEEALKSISKNVVITTQGDIHSHSNVEVSEDLIKIFNFDTNEMQRQIEGIRRYEEMSAEKQQESVVEAPKNTLCGLKAEYRPRGTPTSAQSSDEDNKVMDTKQETVKAMSDKNANEAEIVQPPKLVTANVSSTGAIPKKGQTVETSAAVKTSQPSNLKVVQEPVSIEWWNRVQHFPALAYAVNDITKGYRVLILMRGCPGSGKSHLARHVVHLTLPEERVEDYVFSADDFFMLNNGGHYLYDPTKLSEAHSYNRERVKNALKQGRSPVIVDNTNTKIWEMKDYASMGVQEGYILHVLEPNTPWRENLTSLVIKNVHNVRSQTIMNMLTRYEKYISGSILMRRLSLKYPPNKKPPMMRKIPSLPNTSVVNNRYNKNRKITEQHKRLYERKSQITSALNANEEKKKVTSTRKTIINLDASEDSVTNNTTKGKNECESSAQEKIKIPERTIDPVINKQIKPELSEQVVPNFDVNGCLYDESEWDDSDSSSSFTDTSDEKTAQKVTTVGRKSFSDLDGIESLYNGYTNDEFDEWNNYPKPDPLSQNLYLRVPELKSIYHMWDKPDEYKNENTKKGENTKIHSTLSSVEQDIKRRMSEINVPEQYRENKITKFDNIMCMQVGTTQVMSPNLVNKVFDVNTQEMPREQLTVLDETSLETEEKLTSIQQKPQEECKREERPLHKLLEEERVMNSLKKIQAELREKQSARKKLEHDLSLKTKQEEEQFKGKESEETMLHQPQAEQKCEKYESKKETNMPPKYQIYDIDSCSHMDDDTWDLDVTDVHKDREFDIYPKYQNYDKDSPLDIDDLHWDLYETDVRKVNMPPNHENYDNSYRKIDNKNWDSDNDNKNDFNPISDDTEHKNDSSDIDMTQYTYIESKGDEDRNERSNTISGIISYFRKSIWSNKNRSNDDKNNETVSGAYTNGSTRSTTPVSELETDGFVPLSMNKKFYSTPLCTRSTSNNPCNSESAGEINRTEDDKNTTEVMTCKNFDELSKNNNKVSKDSINNLINYSDKMSASNNSNATTEPSIETTSTSVNNLISLNWVDEPFPGTNIWTETVDEYVVLHKETRDVGTNTVVTDFDIAHLSNVDEVDYRITQAHNRSINEPGKTAQELQVPAKILLLHKGTMTTNTSVLVETEYFDLEDKTDKVDRSDELAKRFQHLPRACIQDVYENLCQRDFNWTMDYLKGLKQHEINLYEVDNVASQPATSEPGEHKKKCSSTDSSTNDSYSRSYPYSPSQSQSQVLTSSPIDQRQPKRKSRGKRNQDKLTKEQLALKQHLEEQVVLSQSSYSQHILQVKTWKAQSDNRSVKFDMNPLSDSTNVREQLNEEVEVPGSSQPQLVSQSYDSDTDINFSETFDVDMIDLTVGHDFIQTLEGIFGAVGSDGIFPVIRVPRSLAQQLHKHWNDSVQRQLQVLQAEVDDMIKQDEKYAKQLANEEEQNAKLEEPASVVNVKQIIEMEVALATCEIDEGLNREQTHEEKELKVIQMTLQQMFPYYDVSALYAILEASNRDLDESIRIIIENTGEKPSVTMADVIKREKNLCSALKSNTAYDTTTDQQQIVDDEGSAECDTSSYSPKTYGQFMSYCEEYRHKAQEQSKLRYENLTRAHAAARTKMYDLARICVERADVHKDKAIRFHEEAAAALLSAQVLKIQDDTKLDLHHLRTAEALTSLDIFIDSHIVNMKSRSKKIIYIVTGRGKHSPGQRSKIKPAVARRLNELNIPFEESNPGMLKIYLQKK